jgi:chitodextrinase
MENKFDKFVKESLGNYEVEYNPAHWDRIEAALDKKARAGRYIWGGAILAGVIIATAVYLNSDNAVPAAPQTVRTEEKQPSATSSAQEVSTGSENKEISNPAVSAPAPGSASATEPVKPEAIKPSGNDQVPGPETTVAAPISKPVSKDLVAAINVSRSQGCVTEPFYFKADVNVPATYQWNFGDGTSSTLPAPSHVYNNAGKYSVTLKVTSLLDGKTIRTGEGGLVVVNAKPFARFNWSVDENDNFSRKVEFNNQSRNVTYAQWIIDGKTYNEDDLSVKFNRKGTYRSSLIVRNELGCYDTLTQNIVLDKDYNLLAPTAFTPNDDNHNDDFLPMLLRNNEINYTMDIVDSKTGNIIFSSGKRPWNGMNQKTGAKAEEGTYLWVVTIIRSDNTKETFKGNVSLLR